MNRNLIKKVGIFTGTVLLFLVIAYGYVPQVLSGKIVNQSDITGFVGMSQEASQWNGAHPGDEARWTNSMFGGMPTVSFMPSHKGDWTQAIYDLLLTGKRPATYLFISLLGAFLLMLSLGINTILAIGGAIAVTFCSYNLQIIQVGHNTKMQALAFLPWVLAAVIFTYKSALKKKIEGWKSWLPMTLLGAVLFGLALSFQIKANHQQITYYLAIVIFIYALYLLIRVFCDKEWKGKAGRFFAASALLLVIGFVGIGTNAVKLAPLYEYTAHTMRGGSELSNPTGGEINQDGLQLDYATAWSYGWEELPNLMIPNFNGGSSAGSVNPDKSEVVKLFREAGQGRPDDIAKALPLYWGPQPFTAGPMYMGAITMFLFILGLFLYKGKEKWWMLAATVVAVLLSLGHNFMWFTKLFYEYAPLYNKFRTVSMALVVLQFTLPMLGFLVLDRIMKQEYSKKEFMEKGTVALALTAGFCLLCVLVPGIAGSFSGASDAGMQDIIADALRIDRRHLLVNDALWSMLLILATFGLIWWAYSEPKSSKGGRMVPAAVAICCLVFVNMFSVGRRYLDSEDFTTPRSFKNQFTARAVDKAILEDPALSYRVVDLTADVFNDAFTSYWHKNIGGYSPAKLQRYQDLIERYIVKELQSVFNAIQGAKTVQDVQDRLPELPLISALNGKYIIVGPDSSPVVNGGAFGNAWFIDEYVPASTPDEEIALIGEVDLRTTAVIGADFDNAREAVFEAVSDADTTAADHIEMTYYSPDELRYKYSTATDRATIFSEVYYADGWTAQVDGKDIDLFRADWILRGAVLPAGEHELVMKFEPKVYSLSENISRATSATLVILLLLSIGTLFLKKKES